MNARPVRLALAGPILLIERRRRRLTRERAALAFAVAGTVLAAAPSAAADALTPGSQAPAIMERRSTGAMIGGIVSLSAGSVVELVLVPMGSLMTSLNCTNDPPWQMPPAATTAECHRAQAVTLGAGIGGAIAVALGIALLVYGAPKVPVAAGMSMHTSPVRPALPAWAGAPGGAGWSWRF